MTVNFYNYAGDFRKCDKSGGLTLLLTYTATYLKEPESLRKVNLRIQYADATDRGKLLSSNYCYIEELGRYYEIIPESVLELGGIIVMSLIEDDIMTNLSEVMALDCVIKRQESKEHSNSYLPDPNYKIYDYTRIQTKEFPSGFPSEKFILAVAGAI